jgi:hypothetical protein
MDTCPAGQFCLSHVIVVIFFVTLVAGLVLLYFQQQNKNTPTPQLPPVNVVIQKEERHRDESRHDRYRRYHDDLHYPEKQYVSSMPINVSTRGEAPDPQQLGVLASDDGSQVLPLFGNPTYPGSNKYKYYTATTNGFGYNTLKLAVKSKNKDCTATYGCDELYDGDHINIPTLQKNMKVSIYANDTPRYIPYI